MRSALALWAPVGAVMALIFWLSSQPVLPAPPGPLTDKEAHFGIYALLSAVWYRALAQRRLSGATAGRGSMAAIASTLYGVSDEWHQRFVPDRSSDVADLLADATGAFAAAVLIFAWGIIATRWRQRRAETAG
jgi:VanZ family protein